MASAFRFTTRAASGRTASEDRAEVFAHEGTRIVVVADGAGGVAGGAVASDAVVAAVRARVAEHPFDPYDMRGWSDVLSHVDHDLAARAAAGETTAIVVAVGVHGVVGVSAGDSEAWMVRARVDRLTEKQDRTRIGTGRSCPMPFHRRAMVGVLVVATDGLFGHARRESIVACCASEDPLEIAHGLVGLPKLRSGTYPDDVAAVVVVAKPAPERRR